MMPTTTNQQSLLCCLQNKSLNTTKYKIIIKNMEREKGMVVIGKCLYTNNTANNSPDEEEEKETCKGTETKGRVVRLII